jgi:hypothetical protein
MLDLRIPLTMLLATLAALPAQRQSPEADKQVLAKLLLQYDKDKNGKIEKAEYPRTGEAFANLDRDRNGVIDAADFTARPGLRARGDGRARPAEETAKLPKVGDVAPDFDLPMLGVKDKSVKLSSFLGDKPVALIFGSYT